MATNKPKLTASERFKRDLEVTKKRIEKRLMGEDFVESITESVLDASRKMILAGMGIELDYHDEVRFTRDSALNPIVHGQIPLCQGRLVERLDLAGETDRMLEDEKFMASLKTALRRAIREQAADVVLAAARAAVAKKIADVIEANLGQAPEETIAAVLQDLEVEANRINRISY